MQNLMTIDWVNKTWQCAKQTHIQIYYFLFLNIITIQLFELGHVNVPTFICLRQEKICLLMKLFKKYVVAFITFAVLLSCEIIFRTVFSILSILATSSVTRSHYISRNHSDDNRWISDSAVVFLVLELYSDNHETQYHHLSVYLRKFLRWITCGR